MTSNNLISKKSHNKKIYTFAFMVFFAILLIFGVKTTLAYYNRSVPVSIVASYVGDYYYGDGDVNMMIYVKQNGRYVRTTTVPASGFTLNDTNTECTITCTKDSPSSACNYSYTSGTSTLTLTSDEKVTCKFYFDSE